MADIETLRREFEEACQNQPLRTYTLHNESMKWDEEYGQYHYCTTQYLFVGFCAGRKVSQAEIEELKAKLKPHEEDPGGYLAVGGFVAEIERLQSIVDRIPKFADGSPALPGDEGWHPWYGFSGRVTYRDAGCAEHLYVGFGPDAGRGILKPLRECYPTIEAMEKANEG